MSAPWMPLYVADYLADTAHLSAAEHGAYLLLIMHYWRAGKLPTDEKQLQRIARMNAREWAGSRDTLAAFFADGWVHKRIENEIAKSVSKSHARAEAGARGGHAKALKNNDAHLANATDLPEQKAAVALASSSQSQSEEDISSLRSDGASEARALEKPILAKPKSPKPDQEKFEEFWQVYPKRDGSNPKEPARQKFNQAVKRGEDPEAIISAAKRYAEQQKRLGNIGTPYVKQATSWLNAKCWLDDYGKSALTAASEDANAKARDFLGRLSATQIESYVQRYFVGQFQWNSGQLGPPPDRPGTLIPPDLINRVKQKQEQAA